MQLTTKCLVDVLEEWRHIRGSVLASVAGTLAI